MPLSPQDILPAIPRQKVKNNHPKLNGAIGEVIEITHDGGMVCVKQYGLDGKSYLSEWILSNCELVTDEQRDFKVGDKIAYELGPKARPDMIGLTQYAIIEGIQCDGCALICGTKLRKEEDMQYLRHATPLEISKYFN
jgi:hypothetical protein